MVLAGSGCVHHGIHHHGIGGAHHGSPLASNQEEKGGSGHPDEHVAFRSKLNGRSRPGEQTTHNGRRVGDSTTLSRSSSPSSTHPQVRRRIERSLTVVAFCEQRSTVEPRHLNHQ